MKYRQEKIVEESMTAIDASLRISNEWVHGRILDKNGNLMPFPCELTAGETYMVEVDTTIERKIYDTR